MIRSGAWPAAQPWSPTIYAQYRHFVQTNAASKRGKTADCADLSLELVVEFAAKNKLPLTFKDSHGRRYISLCQIQWPNTGLTQVLTWNDPTSFLRVIQRRLSASDLYQFNTELNLRGPEPGDLVLSVDHAALVFNVLPSSTSHPLAVRRPPIPVINRDRAKLELDQTEYFDEDPCAAGRVPVLHVDYLNHRGYPKQKAELIYYASAESIKRQRYQFRNFSSSVIDDWFGWDGSSTPPPH